MVLKALYRAAEMFQSKPIGLCEITGIDRITNKDVSAHVSSHNKYKDDVPRWFERLDPSPPGGA